MIHKLEEFLREQIGKDQDVALRNMEHFCDPEGSHMDRWIHTLMNRVLTECEVKWKIMDEHPHEETHYRSRVTGRNFGCQTCHHDDDGTTGPYGYCETIRAISLPYADLPEYKDEWRP